MVKKFMLNGAQDTSLQGYVWEPKDVASIKALMVLVHGLGDHSMRYDKFFKEFSHQGICVYAIDLRGHGNSPGKRGHAAPRNLVLEDIDSICHYAANEHPRIPLFIYGHSMGGNLGLYHRLHGKFRPRGYIISAPWLILYNKLSHGMVTAIRIVSKIAPDLCINNNLDIKDLSSDQSQIDCANDPLYHGFVSVQTGIDCYNCAEEILQKANAEREDLLLLHGTDDHICSVEGSREFMKSATGSCTYIEFEGSYHEIHNDKDREKVACEMLDWIFARI